MSNLHPHMNPEAYKNLTAGEKFIVDWQFELLGNFRKVLIEAIKQADPSNRAKLAKGFPEEVEAYHNYANATGWWQDLCKKLEIEY